MIVFGGLEKVGPRFFRLRSLIRRAASRTSRNSSISARALCGRAVALRGRVGRARRVSTDDFAERMRRYMLCCSNSRF